MYRKIFLDANILVDFIDVQRAGHQWSEKIVIGCLKNKISLYTSCDIVTTVYYLSAKVDKKRALNEISKINQFCNIIDFTNKEVELTCSLMENNEMFKDLEDTIQYVLAKKVGCDLIISNDKNFVSEDIALMSAQVFCESVQ